MTVTYREVITDIDLHGKSSFIRHLELEKKSNGKLVVFIPGIGGFAESYLYNLQPIYEAGYWPVAVDNLGFGGSGKMDKKDLSLTLFSEALVSWLEKIEYDSLHIVGNSFGGGVGMGLYEFIGEKITGFILVSPSGFGKDLWLPYRIASLPIINFIVVRLVINRWLGNRGARSWNTIVYDPYSIPDEIVEAGELYKCDHKIRNAYSFILKNFVSIKGMKKQAVDLVHRLGSKMRDDSIPTLLVWGENDEIIPPTHAVVAQEVLGGKLKMINKCGHMAYVEHIDEFNDILVEFLHNGKSFLTEQ